MLLVSPERLNNPGFRDNVLPRLAADGRAARDRRGALHLRLGPRLPARLPADPDAAGDPARRTSRCSPPPRPPTRGSPRTSPSSCRRPAQARTTGDGASVLRGPLDRESLRLGGRAACRPRPCGWPGWPASLASGALPGSGIIYTLTVAAAYETAAFLREQGIDGHRLQRQGRPGAAARGRGRPARQPGQGAGRDQRARHGVRQARPRASSSTSARRSRRSPTTSRSAAPGAASSAPTWCCCPAGRTATSGRTSPRSPSRRSARSARRSSALADAGRPLSTAALETHVDLSRGRLESMLKVLDVDGAVTPHRRRLGGHRPAVGLRRRALRAGGRGADARAAGDARLPGDRRLPDGVPAARARRPRGGRVRAVRQLHRPALARRRAAGRRGGRAGPARPPGRRRSSRGRCGRPA